MESFQLEVSESNGTEFLLINQKILHKSIVALYEGRGYTDQCMSLVKTCLTELLAHICRNIKFYIHPAWGKFLKKWNQKQDMIQEAHQGTYISSRNEFSALISYSQSISTAAFSLMGNTRKQPKYPSTGEWIKECEIYAMEYYSAWKWRKCYFL